MQTIPQTEDTLLTAQRDIETRASKDGYDRYIKQQDSAVSNLGGHAAAEAVKLIRLTDEGVITMANLRESMAWMAPIHRPMVVPPRPWTGMDTGCYYEPRTARTVKLVRTYNKDHKDLIRKAIEDGTMSHVLNAVNAIQSTAWAINRDIYELVKWCFETGQKVSGIVPNSLMPIRVLESGSNKVYGIASLIVLIISVFGAFFLGEMFQ